MKKYSKALVVPAVFAILVGSAAGRTAGKGFFDGATWKAGFEGDLIGRTVVWDKGTDGSKVRAWTAGIAADLSFAGGLGVSLFAGMGTSDPAGAVFTRLPISLEYQAGSVNGLALGAGLRQKLFAFGNFETKAAVRYVTYTGASKTWPIEGFAADGSAQGKPKWTWLEIGPTLAYNAYQNFIPYLNASLSWFRGEYAMVETMEKLSGTQVRKLAQKGLLKIAVGASWDVGRGVSVDGSAGIVPFKGGSDINASLRILYSF